MKTYLNLFVAALLFTSCQKEEIKPDEDNGTQDKKTITQGLDFDITQNGQNKTFTAQVFKISANSNFDVNQSGINDPNFNELERGGIWDHNIKSEKKWYYTPYGSKGGDFYEPLPTGKYLLYYITAGTRDVQTGSYTIIEIKPNQVLKVRKNVRKNAAYFEQW